MGSISIIVLSMKLFLMSAGAVSLATAGLKLCPPITVKEAPMIWFVIVIWLKPPYLYITINFIIITIGLTSRRFSHEYPRPTRSTVSDANAAADSCRALDLHQLPEDMVVEKAIVAVHESGGGGGVDYVNDEEMIICAVDESADGEEEETEGVDVYEVVEAAEMAITVVEEADYEKHPTIESTWKMITDQSRCLPGRITGRLKSRLIFHRVRMN